MTIFQINGKDIYIDDRLKSKLDERVIPQLKHKDKDFVFVTDGDERVGKSVFTMGVCSYIASQLGTRFDNYNICMTPVEFRNKVMKVEKRSVVIYDEAHRGMASSRSLSEINNLLKDLMMEMGQKNLFIMIVIPSFFLLDKYAALFRAKGLFHVYERKGKRGYWCFFNRRNKLKLYQKGKKDLNYNCMKWPHFRGRFMDQYPVNEDEYRKKKGESFSNKERITKSECWMEQRDVLLYILHKELNLSSIQLSNLLKNHLNGDAALKDRQIRDILSNFKQTYQESGIGGGQHII